MTEHPQKRSETEIHKLVDESIEEFERDSGQGFDDVCGFVGDLIEEDALKVASILKDRGYRCLLCREENNSGIAVESDDWKSIRFVKSDQKFPRTLAILDFQEREV